VGMVPVHSSERNIEASKHQHTIAREYWTYKPPNWSAFSPWPAQYWLAHAKVMAQDVQIDIYQLLL